jgi:hypothetical protein
VTELDVPKEAKPSFYLQHILPLLLKTRVVLFEGFGNRLAFDPVPFDIQVFFCNSEHFRHPLADLSCGAFVLSPSALIDTLVGFCRD